MRAKHGLVAALVVVAGVATASGAMAQGVAPAVLPMQGYLTDGGGAPVDGSTDLTVNLYDGQLSSTVLYGEDQSVMVDAGNFTAYVGDGTPSAGALDMAIFRDNSDVWVGITIGSGTELPRFQLGSVPYAAFAQYSNSAGNATQLGGVDPSSYQNRVTGACGAGEAITAIAANGTVTCATVGDITGVTAGVGIMGGGTSGDVTLNINPAVVQSRVTGTCPVGQAITAIAVGGTVTCAASGGDITGVTAGTGLTGGGATGTVTLNADPAYLQRRVSGTCAPGEAMVSIAADGTVTCGPAVNRQRDMSRASRIAIANGVTYRFGCYLGSVSGAFTGTQASCHSTYYCPTGGQAGTDSMTTVTLTAGDNYLLGTAFVASATGYCIVNSTIEFSSSYSLTGSDVGGAPFYRVGYNNGVNRDDGNYGHYP